jgi:hypothetical protein
MFFSPDPLKPSPFPLLVDVILIRVLLIIPLIMLGIYAGISIYQKQVPLWALPGLGFALPGIMMNISVLHNLAHLPSSSPPTMEENAVRLMITVLSLLIAGTFIVWGAHFARRARSSVGILLILPSLSTMIVVLGDATYAWSLWWPNIAIWEALTEAGIAAIPLIILPILVLRQEHSSQINKTVIGLSLLTMELAIAAGLVRAVGMVQKAVINAPTLAESIQHMLTVEQVLMLPWLVPIVGLLLLYTSVGHSGDDGHHISLSRRLKPSGCDTEGLVKAAP